MLPVVNTDLLRSMKAEFDNDKKLNHLDSDIVKNVNSLMQKENPILWQLMVNYIRLADMEYGPDSLAGTTLLSAITLMYKLLHSQSEIDEMEKQYASNN